MSTLVDALMPPYVWWLMFVAIYWIAPSVARRIEKTAHQFDARDGLNAHHTHEKGGKQS